MNKLVIVGNGFDLAHNLPTSYKHFIDDFWSKFKSNYTSEEYKELVYVKDLYVSFFDFGPINTFDDLLSNLTSYCSEYSGDREFDKDKMVCTALESNGRKTDIFKFKNEFFHIISVKSSIENWVDIENEYYQKLKGIVKNNDWDVHNKKEKVVKLNYEFEQIKNLLNDYLIRSVNERYDLLGRIQHFEYLTRLLEIKPRYIESTKDSEGFLKEFPVSEHPDLIKFDNEIVEANENGQLRRFLTNGSRNTVFLNFNYTNTLYRYIDIMNNGQWTMDNGQWTMDNMVAISKQMKSQFTAYWMI